MASYIKSVTPILFNGAFSVRIDFQPGLNIISGENGTGKTQLLALLKQPRHPGMEQLVRQHKIEIENGSYDSLRVQAISPQRNAERKNFLNALQEMRRNNKGLDQYLQQIDSQTIVDNTFTTYPSVAEHYYYEYDALCHDGGNQIEKMQEATRRLNDIIHSILDNLELHAEWDAGYPRLSIRKSGNEFPIDALSCGEKEILALILNLYLSRDKYDVFLIDEPEIHLNWHLEERLFKHLKDFCSTYQKQVILSCQCHIRMSRNVGFETSNGYWSSATD